MNLIDKELKYNFKYLVKFIIFIIISLAIYVFLPKLGSSDLLNVIYSLIMFGNSIMLVIASIMTVMTIMDIRNLLKLKNK